MVLEELFFELIRLSLGTQKYPSDEFWTRLMLCPSGLAFPGNEHNDVWQELYRMAWKQSLTGICFSAISNLSNSDEDYYAGMNHKLFYKWAENAIYIQNKNGIVNGQCIELQKKLSDAGFRTFIMKGQGNAALYGPLASFRQSGDIDVYLEGGFEKVNTFVQNTCPTNEINEVEIHYHCYDSISSDSVDPTEVEIHYHPIIMRNPFKNKRLQSFFGELFEDCYVNKISLGDSGQISVPTFEFNLVHQLVHIHHHLFTEGVGFRQLMDYYFILKSHKIDESTKHRFKKIISILGLDRFASALIWAIVYVFEGSDFNKSTLASGFGFEPSEKNGRSLLNEMLISGNFGMMDRRNEGIYISKWKSFWYVNTKAIRLAKFDHWSWFWCPLWRVYHFTWRKLKGYQ